MTILEHVRKESPQAHILVRSRYEIHTHDFLAAGAHLVRGDEQQVGESLAEHLTEWMKTHVVDRGSAT
jgi:CPA2 family monovalent cation:H+ antiporter-2